MKKIVLLTLTGLLLLALWGCGEPAEGSPSAEEPAGTPLITEGAYYVYSNDHGTGILAADGSVLLPMNYDRAQVLYDQWSGEPVCLLAGTIRDKSEVVMDEYGYALGDCYDYQLFDLQGQLVRELEQSCDWVSVAGDWLLLSKSTVGDDGYIGVISLVNAATGDVLYENCQEIQTGLNCFLIRQEGGYSLLDAGGRLVRDLPELAYAYNLGYEMSDCFVVSDSTDQQGVLGAAGEYLLPCQYQSIDYVGPGFAMAFDGRSHILDLASGELVYESDDSISYYDGQRLVQTGDDGRCHLCDKNGKALSAGFDSLFQSTVDQKGEPVFNGTAGDDQEGRRQVLIGADGGELYGCDDSGYLEYMNGAVLVNVAADDFEVRLCDTDGTELAGEKYDYMMSLYGNSGGRYAAPAVQYCDGSYRLAGAELHDVLDATGTARLTQLKAVDQLDADHFLVSKGFSRGIMDINGVWLYEESAFSGMND